MLFHSRQIFFETEHWRSREQRFLRSDLPEGRLWEKKQLSVVALDDCGSEPCGGGEPWKSSEVMGSLMSSGAPSIRATAASRLSFITAMCSAVSPRAPGGREREREEGEEEERRRSIISTVTTTNTEDKLHIEEQLEDFFFTSLKDVGGGATQQLPDAANAVLLSGVEERDVVDAKGRRDTTVVLFHNSYFVGL